MHIVATLRAFSGLKKRTDEVGRERWWWDTEGVGGLRMEGGFAQNTLYVSNSQTVSKGEKYRIQVMAFHYNSQQ